MIYVIKEERDDPMAWSDLCGRAEGMAPECGIEPSITVPRLDAA